MGENSSQWREDKTFLDPFLLTLLLVLVSLGFVVFLFLPSIIEALKPKDRGPRRILRTPLQEMIRRISGLAFTSTQDSADSSSTSTTLQDILKEVGVKTRRIGKNTLRIFGDVSFPPSLEISDNIVVEGALTVGDRCVFHGSVKAKGYVLIGNGVVIEGNTVSKRNVDIQDETVIGGSIHAEGSVRLGEKVFVGLSVVADGDVELYENSEVRKNIITQGVIKVLKYPRLDLPSTIEDIG